MNPQNWQVDAELAAARLSVYFVQIEEMDKAVDAAENNMARFNLTQQEVASRRKWVTKTQQQVPGLPVSPSQTVIHTFFHG